MLGAFRAMGEIREVVRTRNTGKGSIDCTKHCGFTTMTLDPTEFIRRFLLHVLPKGFHRIRHYGLLASGVKADNLARIRELLDVAPPPQPEPDKPNAADIADVLPMPCPCCGSQMRVIEGFEAGCQPRHRPNASAIIIRLDTS